MPEHNQNKDNITKAFEPDYLNRKALAVEWTDALLSTKLNHHLVISVSGDWGTGKTYLAKNWHKYLEEQGYFTCYIDAHKKDYAEDPLLIIMSEIESAVNKYMKAENGAIKEAFGKVKNSFLPFLVSGFKTVAKVGAGILLPDIIPSNILKIIDNIDGEKLKKIIKGSIDEYNNKKDSRIEEYYDNIKAYSKNIEEFKQALEEFADTIADKLNKPVVIFIDELDRSNPKFVIKLIEQLKHIFEIPNLAFILTVNKKELSNTIKGIYGSEMDGYAYYKKFTTHDFTLYSIDIFSYADIMKYTKYILSKYDLFDLNEQTLHLTSFIISSLKLSLRDIEQIVDYLYYIKDKITQKYNKEYIIICFFYRAMYVCDYKQFMINKEKFEYGLLDTHINDGKHVFSFLFKLIIEDKIYNDNNLTYYIFKKIILEISDDELHNIFENNKLITHPYLLTQSGTNIFHQDILYALIPIVSHGYDEDDIPIPCKTPKEVKDRIFSIRKNLIQLSMLGAVPKDNIRK